MPVTGKERKKVYEMRHLVEDPTMWFPNRSDTNRPVQLQKQARSLKLWSKVEEELYYPSSENKGADQLRGCFRLCRFYESLDIIIDHYSILRPSQDYLSSFFFPSIFCLSLFFLPLLPDMLNVRDYHKSYRQ